MWGRTAGNNAHYQHCKQSFQSFHIAETWVPMPQNYEKNQNSQP